MLVDAVLDGEETVVSVGEDEDVEAVPSDVEESVVSVGEDKEAVVVPFDEELLE